MLRALEPVAKRESLSILLGPKHFTASARRVRGEEGKRNGAFFDMSKSKVPTTVEERGREGWGILVFFVCNPRNLSVSVGGKHARYSVSHTCSTN